MKIPISIHVGAAFTWQWQLWLAVGTSVHQESVDSCENQLAIRILQCREFHIVWYVSCRLGLFYVGKIQCTLHMDLRTGGYTFISGLRLTHLLSMSWGIVAVCLLPWDCCRVCYEWAPIHISWMGKGMLRNLSSQQAVPDSEEALRQGWTGPILLVLRTIPAQRWKRGVVYSFRHQAAVTCLFLWLIWKLSHLSQ